MLEIAENPQHFSFLLSLSIKCYDTTLKYVTTISFYVLQNSLLNIFAA
jgi:hypothetical protein